MFFTTDDKKETTATVNNAPATVNEVVEDITVEPSGSVNTEVQPLITNELITTPAPGQTVVDAVVDGIVNTRKQPLQFTAKANGLNKDFADYIEKVITWRIEKGLSRDRQHCIFQMFNFSANYADGWEFATPEIKKLYLTN